MHFMLFLCHYLKPLNKHGKNRTGIIMTEQNDKEYYNSTALESIDRIAYQARLSLERYKDQSSFERVERLLENDINMLNKITNKGLKIRHV
jgi:hypothetical protein